MDYEENSAHVTRFKVIRMFVAFAFYKKFILYQMDVKSVFLNGFIKEKVFVEQPLGFGRFYSLNHVFKLENALYGLK